MWANLIQWHSDRLLHPTQESGSKGCVWGVDGRMAMGGCDADTIGSGEKKI